ncbi:MAG: phosphopantetheine-binding protein [Clostridiales bacterium]|jgi:acyl carrier protein|nr:phosphopantetheine-binding protein [Clostridiales bacterium]
MSHNKMLQGITEILREYKSADDLEVTEETTFESLSLDSLDTVELVMMVEEKFSVTIEMAKGIKAVADLMSAIEKAE